MSLLETVAIIPAYNEAPRISKVLETVLSCPLINETIVVDDGSTDGTAETAAAFPVKLIRLSQNMGKGAALQVALEEVYYASYYIFLDADLLHLNHEHIKTLLSPLKEKNPPSMTIGVFKAGNKNSVNLAQKYFSVLNGQRGLRRDFVEILPELKWSRFGVEVLLTRFAKLTQRPVHYPELNGITHVTKEEKLGFIKGFTYRLQMFRECLYAHFKHKKMIDLYPGNTPQEILDNIRNNTQMAKE